MTLRKLEQYWTIMEGIRATAITRGSQIAIEQVMEDFAEQMEAIIRGDREWTDSREQRAGGWN